MDQGRRAARLGGTSCRPDNRDFGSAQVLRTWRRQFTSLHELLCAVEASWVYKNNELAADFVFPNWNVDLGPSRPGPTVPPLLGKPDDAVILVEGNGKSNLVTALAIAEENGKGVLYSGHADGVLAKWCLEDNTKISRPSIPTVTNHFRISRGVTGLVVRSGESDDHSIYTWSEALDNYSRADYENRTPSKVKCWSGKDGTHVRSYTCDVGLDTEGEPAIPLLPQSFSVSFG